MEKILIVDDVKANAQLISFILEAENYELSVANDGYDALKQIENENFDLILLDIMMPGIDGIETCRRIREDSKNADTPVIFLSANNDINIIVSGFDAGGNDYLSKPFKNEELVVRIKTHLDLRKRRSKLSQENQQLENLDSLKNNFLKQFSSHLKRPLSEILKITYLLKELVESKELVAFINKMDTSVKQLEKFATTALLLNDLKLSKNELEIQRLSLHSICDAILLEQSAIFNANNYLVAFSGCDKSYEIFGDRKLIELALTKVFEAIMVCHPQDTQVNIKVTTQDEKVQLQFDISGTTPEAQKSSMNFDQNLPLMLAQLVFKLHEVDMEFSNEGKTHDHMKISFNTQEI